MELQRLTYPPASPLIPQIRMLSLRAFSKDENTKDPAENDGKLYPL
jgi:hypothetical protein